MTNTNKTCKAEDCTNSTLHRDGLCYGHCVTLASFGRLPSKKRLQKALDALTREGTE